MKGKLIVFLGPVGAGKSTHAMLLCRVLRRRWGKVFGKFTVKTHHFLGYVLEWLLVRIVFGGDSRANEYTPIRVLFENRPKLFSSVFKLWCIVDFLSTLFVFLVVVVFPLKLGYTVVIEEGLLAALADYVWLSRWADVSWREKFVRIPLRVLLVLCLAYRPFLAVYLDADFNVLWGRWRLRDTPEERYDYVLMQKRLLKALCRKLYCCHLVDTTSSTIAETAKQIIRLVVQHSIRRQRC